jgi:hypothetical protein
MTTRPSKRELLEDYLGNFDEYIFTGWMIDNTTSDMTDPANWECHWKTPLYPLTDFKPNQFPTILGACHCTTPIIWNCLIKHKPTGRLEFVGSVCMHYFDMNLKRCIQCNKPNRSSYRRCKTCRKLCKLHGEYHDDNAVHTRPPPQPRVVPPQPRVVPTQPLAEYEIESDPIPQMYLDIRTHPRRRSIPLPIQRHLHEGYMNSVLEPKTPRRSIDAGYDHCDTLERDDQDHVDFFTPPVHDEPFSERKLTFGKYKGFKPYQLINLDPEGENYFFWLFKCDLLTEIDKIDLGMDMYLNTIPPKGKYRYASVAFVEIKRKDPSYYDWMKRTWSDAFVKYLP